MTITGLADQRRLEEIARLALHGRLADPGLDAVAETNAAALTVPMSAVNIVTPNLQTFAAEVGMGVPCTNVPDDLAFCAEVVRTGQPFLLPDAAAHEVYCRHPLVVSGNVGAYAGFPLVHRGAVIGTICVLDDHPREFTPTELVILAFQAKLASTVLALRYAASHDSLTLMANRARGAEFAEQALATPPTSALFVDLDDFKSVNDQHGHEAGDRVLRELAARMENAVAGSDYLVVRWGGDEFLIVMPSTDAAAAEAVADRLVALAACGNESITVGMTIGVATTYGQDDLDELVRSAGSATAAGKKEGKGCVRTHHADRREFAVRQRTR